MITLKDYITASGLYPAREKSPELTAELLGNAEALLKRVNALLQELGISKSTVTSGFRPSAVNANIANASKTSHHQRCRAVDILDDKDQSLSNKLLKDAEDNKQNSLLAKHGLYMEHPQHTVGKRTNWLHLQDVPPGSKSLVFKLKFTV
jgi:hypothetical protein